MEKQEKDLPATSAPSEVILPRECLSLPPERQEGVMKVLTRLQEMEKKWFKLRTPEELNQIIPQVNEAARRLSNALKQKPPKKWPQKFEFLAGPRSENWARFKHLLKVGGRSDEKNAARGEAHRMVSLPARRAAKEALSTYYSELHETASKHISYAITEAGRYVSWEVVRDQPGFENNLYDHLFSLYEMGAVDVMFRKVNGREKLVIHFPLKLFGVTPILGCVVAGDKEVRYYHPWNRDCSSSITPLKTSREIS